MTNSFAISQGTKFINNFIISSYTKYTNKTNCHPIYKKTIYQQLSVAKKLDFSNNGLSTNVTAQIGYFWNNSLKIHHYKTSGIVFSLSTED
ncbi:MAG: hypothetical protein EOP33_01975 [Rickettsiaceae bacterium]|nr:MAG: hypothetical protein EOP33_01975 [Rickettsiaceae bacterium]